MTKMDISIQSHMNVHSYLLYTFKGLLVPNYTIYFG